MEQLGLFGQQQPVKRAAMRDYNIIYTPKGPAREYAERACNIYKGCQHACRYCFGKRRLSENQKRHYDNDPNPKDYFVEKFKYKADRLNGDTPEILLSFLGDVYQPIEMELRLTRQALESLVENDLPFTILTKGGTRAVRDFDLLEGYGKGRFGTTLVFMDQGHADHWEPGAASIDDGIKAIEEAHNRGIKTWVSVEPVIDPSEAFRVIRELYPIVDHWKVGKINKNKALERKVDWIAFRGEVKGLLDDLSTDYYLKKSLTEL